MDYRKGGSLAELQEESVKIAWDYLRGTGESGDRQEAVRFLSDIVERWIRQGSRSRLMLSNKAIMAYRDFKLCPKSSGPAIVCSV
ncbi:MAG: hypothetical protein JWO28_47 [Hyphomicrobiales bacterium]|nr:hypothetical protein [Hyphomicrobiales bacterium]